jgi:hypothetical protein
LKKKLSFWSKMTSERPRRKIILFTTKVFNFREKKNRRKFLIWQGLMIDITSEELCQNL